MATNQELIDATIDRQVDQQLYANDVVREEVGRLNSSDEELFVLLLAALLALPPERYTPAQLEWALQPALAVNASAYAEIGADLNARLREAVAAEADYQHLAAAGLVGDGQQPATPVDKDRTFFEALAVPIMGVTLSETLRQLSEARAAKIRSTVQAGYVAGHTADEIVRELRGTRAAAYSDGALNAARANLETVVRSSLSHMFEYTRAAFYALNSELVASVIWLSVLDGRTSPPCIARAGKRYTAATHRPIGHSYEWGAGPGRYHYNCRSTFAPLVRGEVPADNSYDAWLRRQPAARQDEILGPTRGKVYRSSGDTVTQFVNNKGRLLTLEEFRSRSGR